MKTKMCMCVCVCFIREFHNFIYSWTLSRKKLINIIHNIKYCMHIYIYIYNIFKY